MSAQQSYRIKTALATIKAEPDENAANTSEGLYGEWVDVISSQDNWRHIRLHRDGYDGFIAEHNLESIPDESVSATHVVDSRSTLLFSKPSVKSPVVMRLPFRAHLCVAETIDESFSKTDTDHFVWSSHIAASGTQHRLTPLQLAQSHFLGAPYLWGGCSPDGLDCSGLVQALALSQGIRLPRDSKDQEIAVPTSIDYENRQAADLLYWPGHTAILLDRDRLLHATANSLNCLVESVDSVVERAGSLSSVRRLFHSSVC